MKPPAPVTTTRSFLDIDRAFPTKRGLLPDFSKTCEVGPTASRGRGRRSGRRAGLFVCSYRASPSSRPVTRAGNLVKSGGSAREISYTHHIGPFFDRQGVVLADITPVILTYNEAANIGRSLERLTWARQVVIVDSGSTDETLAIAGRFANVRVVHRPFDTHARQWRFAVEETGIASDWLLRLDADYMVEPALRDEIAALLPAAATAAYEIAFTYCIEGRPLRASLYPSLPVLFRRGRARFEQDGHTEKLQIDGPVERVRNRLLHDDRKSLERWLQIAIALPGAGSREAQHAAVVGAELGRPAAAHAAAGAARGRGALPVREGIDIRRIGRSSLYSAARDRRPHPLHAPAAPRSRPPHAAQGGRMTYILGLNAYHADAAACLVKDGTLVAAVEEERFRRIKHWGGFPSESIRYCLAEAGIALGDVEHVAVNSDNRANRWRKLAYVLTSGVRPGLRAESAAPARRPRRRRGQPQAASARAGVPRHRACRRASSLPSRLGLPGVALRQGGCGVGRRLRRFLLGAPGGWGRAAISPSTAASTSRIRSACSTRR